ncbi:MAG: hypothetical protein N2510_08610 [Ignavibacteria bacterium]|nr:hypothetical protein [Ignavibacteria bacterium]
MNQNISIAVYIIPSVITLSLTSLITYILYRNGSSRAIVLIISVSLWLIYCYLVSSGKFSVHEKLIFIYLPVSVIIIYFIFSGLSSSLLNRLLPQYFIYIQLFRLFTEIYLWIMFLDGIIPVQLTFSGLNYDIFIPLTALLIGYFVYSSSKWPELAALFWNIAGIILSLNIALLYISIPLELKDGNLVIFLSLWPVIFSVPLAILIHLLSVKQMFLGRYSEKN